LIDLHSHLFLHPYNETSWDNQILKESVAYRSVRATGHARETLLSGFTLLRDLGTEGAGASDVSLKRAIDEGLIPGPRLLVVTRAIVATASYGVGPRGYAEDLSLRKALRKSLGLPNRQSRSRANRPRRGLDQGFMPITAEVRAAKPSPLSALTSSAPW